MSLGAAIAARADERVTIRFGFAVVGVDNRQFSGGNAIATAHAEHYVENELKDLPNVKIEWFLFKGAGSAVNEEFASGQFGLASQGDLPQVIGRASGLKTTILAAGVPTRRSTMPVATPSFYDTPFYRPDQRHGRPLQRSGRPPIIDELRPFTVDVWQAMSLPDRQRFLRHLRPWWDVHRHRMAGPVADCIDKAQGSGQLQIAAGRVRDYTVVDYQVEVLFRPRGTEQYQTMRAAWVVNCSGPGADYDRIQEPPVRSLLAEGIVPPGSVASGPRRDRQLRIARS